MPFLSLESTRIYFLPLVLMSSYVVASAIKAFINEKGMMSSGDLAEHASKFLEEALAKAVKRASANGRKTVRGEDL
jgi:histone H3/H4